MKKPAWLLLRESASLCTAADLDEYGVPDEARAVFKVALADYVIDGAYGLWNEPTETHDGHTPEALAVTLAQRISTLCEIYSDGGTKSPIEHRMVAAMHWLEMDWAGFPRHDFMGGPEGHLQAFGESEGISFYITPQAQVGRYRADFLLWFLMGRTYGGVIVECDGHDFHEKTKEQAARDKSRDRELLAAGYPVMRFTGSEIFRDPIGCAEQVRVPLSAVLYRVSKEGGLF